MSRRNRRKERRQAARQAKRAATKTIRNIRKVEPADRSKKQTRKLKAAKTARAKAQKRIENNRTRNVTNQGPGFTSNPGRSNTNKGENTNIRKQDFGNKLNASEVRDLLDRGVSRQRIEKMAGKRNIEVGGKAQALLQGPYSIGQKFSMSDARRMRDAGMSDRKITRVMNRFDNQGGKVGGKAKRSVTQLGSDKFQNLSLEQQAEMVKGNKGLRSSKEGQAILSQARGQVGADGKYDYGLKFGQGDIKRMTAAGMNPNDIANFINQEDIDNKVSRRFLMTVDESQKTPAPDKIKPDVPPESGNLVDTTPTTTTEGGDGEPTETVETGLDNFDLKDIQDYLNNQGYSITENTTPQPTPEPTPAPQYNQEQSGLDLTFGFGSPEATVLPTPVATGDDTTSPAPTSTPKTRESPFKDYISDFRNEQATTLADARELMNAPATDKPLVNVDRPVQSQQYFTPSPIGPSGQPYIQVRGAYNNMPYTLDEDGMPVYSTFTYQTGSTVPGQVVPGGPDLYEPQVPPMPKVELNPYDPRKQYGPGGMGYLPLQPRGIAA